MENLSVVNRVFEETNPYYDENRCHNGGGYSQPHIELMLSDGKKVVINDTSCGDFGCHYVIILLNGEVEEAVCSKDVEINGAGDYVRNEFSSSFDEVQHADVIALIESEEGYRVPSAHQCAIWDAEEKANNIDNEFNIHECTIETIKDIFNSGKKTSIAVDFGNIYRQWFYAKNGIAHWTGNPEIQYTLDELQAEGKRFWIQE